MAYLEILASTSLWVAMVRIATPYIFGTLGELLCERAGVINLGIEGIMTIGAAVGWLSVHLGCSLWTGVSIAAIAGMVFGLLHGLLTSFLALSQHVTGLGITMLATGVSSYGYRTILPSTTNPPSIAPFEAWSVPGLSKIPLLGPAFFEQTPLTYLSYFTVGVIAYVLYRTPIGLTVRMVGESPQAAEARGIHVHLTRVVTVILGSALMAIGGAFLTLSAFNAFYVNMVQGRGWICIALVVFASRLPGMAFISALLFAGFDAFQLRLQQELGSNFPYQVFLMLPYVLSIVAMTIMARRSSAPKALMTPYVAGQT
jgi:simple sugar transport system permease protein